MGQGKLRSDMNTPVPVTVVEAEGDWRLDRCMRSVSDGSGAVDVAAAEIVAWTRGRMLWCRPRQDLFAPALAAIGFAPLEAGDEKVVLANRRGRDKPGHDRRRGGSI